MLILLKLLLAHFVGDFVLQPKGWVSDKETKKIASLKLYYHILIHGVLIMVLLWNWQYWLLALTIMIIHLIIDLAKLSISNFGKKTILFFLDQFFHLISIGGVWIIICHVDFCFSQIFCSPAVWAFALAIVFLTQVSNIFIRKLLSNFTHYITTENNSLSNAGKYIGMLERLFVFVLILTNHWDAIGFLLAAKSVFRFGDLKEANDRKLTEYILIGTLLSFGIAILCGLVFLKLTLPTF